MATEAEMNVEIDRLVKFSVENKKGGRLPTEKQQGYNLALDHLSVRLDRIKNLD